MTAPPPSNRSKASTPPLDAAPTSLISASATCTGAHRITLGSMILQPRACLTSIHGPIRVGDGCIISERASIGLLSPPGNETEAKGVTLSPGVLIGTCASVEAVSIGAYTVVEAGAKIGKGTVVGANSKVCAGIEIGEGIVVEDNTVVYQSGWGGRRKEKRAFGQYRVRKRLVELQEDTLRRMWTGR